MNLPQLSGLRDQVVTLGSTIVTEPAAEEAVLWLLNIEKWAKETMVQLKTAIAERADKDIPNFTGVKGDHLKVEYRESGAKYKLSESFDPEKDYDPMLVKREVKYSPIASAVETYKQSYGELPPFIEEVERKKVVILKEI